MVLSHLGAIAEILWCKIPNHEKYVKLGDFEVMPNHIHGILIVDNNSNIVKTDVDEDVGGNVSVDGIDVDWDAVETRLIASLQSQ